MNEPTESVTSKGLTPNVAGALAYVFGPLTGILFLIAEKEDAFVRFHAAHSIVVGVAWIALALIVAAVGGVLVVVPILGWLISSILSLTMLLVGLSLWFFLMYQAFNGQEWEMPIVGRHARRLT